MLNIKQTKTLCLTWSALVLAACGGGSAQNNSPAASAAASAPSQTQAQTAKSGVVYRVITEYTEPPLITYVSDKPTGFEYDLLEAIAAKQGFSLKYDVTTRPLLLKSVIEDKADIAAGAITITEERKQTVDFSDPILDYTPAVLVVKSLADAKGFADLRGKKVASRKSTVYEQMALEELGNEKGDNIRYYETAWLQVKSLLNGTEEVTLSDSHLLEYYVNQHGQDKVAFVKGIPFEKEHYGFVVKKGNTELQKQLNDGLAAIKADGTYDKIRQVYWGK